MDQLRKRYPESAIFVATAKVVNPDETDRFVAKASLAPLRGLLPAHVNPQDKPDLLFISSNGAVAGLANRNGDSVSAETAVAIHRTAEWKFISVDHSRDDVKGVVLFPGLTAFGTNEPITEQQALDLKAPFNMAFVGALWKVIDGKLTKYIRRMNGDLDEDALSVSWEILFDQFDIGIGSRNLWDARIVRKGDPEFDDMVPRLKGKGGNGKNIAGEDIFRIIKGDAIILGYSIVTNPAAEVHGILPLVAAEPAPAPAAPVAAESVGPAHDCETLEPLPLADGNYTGIRHGYSLEIDGKEYATKAGLRCTRESAFKVNVSVEQGRAKVAYTTAGSAASDTVAPVVETTAEAASAEVVAPVAATPDQPVAAAAPETTQPTPSQATAAEKIITPAETRVTPNNAPMKIESVEQLTTLWPELRKEESVASIASFVSALQKANEQHAADVTAQKGIAQSLEQAKAAAELRANELQTSLAQVQKQVEDLRTAAVAAEDNRKFQERMASFDEQYALDDEDRQLIASDIKGLNDEAFAAFQKKCAKLMGAKKKGAATASAAVVAAVTATTVTQAIASVTEIAGQGVVPPGKVVTDSNLAAEAEEAFAGTIKINGKSVKEHRAAKATKAAK